MSVERKLAAIMFTDIVGFTKIMTESEDSALKILKSQDRIFTSLVKTHNGNLLKKMGDGLLIEFSSAVNAVKFAIDVQSDIEKNNTNSEYEFHVRIGIHLGDILVMGDDILGDGVNIASRIEPLASPDGICITEAVHQSIKSKLKIDAKRVTEVDLKHIDDKYTLYKLPKLDDHSFEHSNHIDLKLDKNVIVDKIEDKTKHFNEFLNALRYLIPSTLIALSSFLILNYFFGFITFTINNFLLLPIVVLLGTFFQYRIVIKVTFHDIRDIPFFLDIIIKNMAYKMVSKDKNSLKYIHKPKKDFMVNKFKENKYYEKYSKNLNLLEINFDGNIVVISGSKYHVNKIIKNINKRNK